MNYNPHDIFGFGQFRSGIPSLSACFSITALPSISRTRRLTLFLPCFKNPVTLSAPKLLRLVPDLLKLSLKMGILRSQFRCFEEHWVSTETKANMSRLCLGEVIDLSGTCAKSIAQH